MVFFLRIRIWKPFITALPALYLLGCLRFLFLVDAEWGSGVPHISESPLLRQAGGECLGGIFFFLIILLKPLKELRWCRWERQGSCYYSCSGFGYVALFVAVALTVLLLLENEL